MGIRKHGNESGKEWDSENPFPAISSRNLTLTQTLIPDPELTLTRNRDRTSYSNSDANGSGVSENCPPVRSVTTCQSRFKQIR